MTGMPDIMAPKEEPPTKENKDTGESLALNSRKKRKVALFLMYVGHGYQGMQRNPDCKSIEADLFEAINKAGGISDANADEEGFQKVHWSRAARTDKGVSAMCQVVSLMMVLEPPGIVERINQHLPDQIRVLGYQRAVKGYDSRKVCDKRRYEYIFPAWMFDPAVQPMGNHVNANGNALFSGDDLKLKIKRTLSERDPSFVFDGECHEKLTAILKQFEGSHNFHNYTVRMDASSPQAKRYILEFTCKGTIDIQGESWVRLVVIGQSFMLHQIRKMVGMAVAEYKGIAPKGSLMCALKSRQRIVVPMAPDLGLFLDKCYYDAYNKRWGDLHGCLDSDTYAEEVEKFRREKLFPSLAQRDRDDNVNSEWLQYIHEDSYKFNEWASGKPIHRAAKSTKRKHNGDANTTQEPKKQQSKALSIHLSAEYSD